MLLLLWEALKVHKPITKKEKLKKSIFDFVNNASSSRLRKPLLTHPLGCVFHTVSVCIWQDSSTIGFHFPLLSLAVIVLIEDVKTTLFTELDFKQDLSRFMVPLIAGSIIFVWTKFSASSIPRWNIKNLLVTNAQTIFKKSIYMLSPSMIINALYYQCFLSH